jgi:hypothetical protein
VGQISDWALDAVVSELCPPFCRMGSTLEVSLESKPKMRDGVCSSCGGPWILAGQWEVIWEGQALLRGAFCDRDHWTFIP